MLGPGRGWSEPAMHSSQPYWDKECKRPGFAAGTDSLPRPCSHPARVGAPVNSLPGTQLPGWGGHCHRLARQQSAPSYGWPLAWPCPTLTFLAQHMWAGVMSPGLHMLQDRRVGGGGLGQRCPPGRGPWLSCHPPQGCTYPLVASRVSHLAPAPGSAPQHEAVGGEGQSTQLGVTCSPPIKLPSPTD